MVRRGVAAAFRMENRERMAAAAAEIADAVRILEKGGGNLTTEMLRGRGQLTEWEHYPPDDVYDPKTHAQYFFHAHPIGAREWQDYGHFHTFLRPKGMPPDIKPAPLPDFRPPSDNDDATCHLIGISMNRDGLPEGLFTTNRWVTGETWYAASDVIAMLDHFVVDLSSPSREINRWITAMLVLFRPQIERLLRLRDLVIRRWARRYPDTNVYEDRELEIVAALEIPPDCRARLFGNGSDALGFPLNKRCASIE